jgi:radical SAM protein (TIGR01212 family)
MVWVEYGLQSTHDETLRRINRGHDFNTFLEAVEKTARKGVLVCAHLIIGLPGENFEHVRSSAEKISSLPLNGIKLHSLFVVHGTPLEKLYHQGDYRPWTQTEYVESVCDFLERIPAHWVIQRLTGDPDHEQLVAPSWTLRKQETLSMIRDCLHRRNTWQGRLLGAKEPEENKDSIL